MLISSFNVFVGRAQATSVWTTQMAAGSRYWSTITSSADGTHLAAAVGYNGGGYIYTSADSGATWTPQTLAGSRRWWSITSSADGTHLAAAVGWGGGIFTSTDSGATWTDQTDAGGHTWYSITSSSDGEYLAAVANYGYIYTSTDGGATWTPQTSAGSRGWVSITSSSDGSRLAAVAGGGDIYTSTDGGATWTNRTTSTSLSSLNWSSISSSADGSRLAAVVNYGDIYTSTDGGATWTDHTFAAGPLSWSAITSSSDGERLAATVQYGDVYTSPDGGATWVDQTTAGSGNWVSIASSADGSNVAALRDNGRIYTSTLNLTPPTISSIVNDPGLSTAVITWNTDNAATSQVVYGKTGTYDSATSSAALTTSHALTLTELAPNTTYHFQIRSTDIDANVGTSTDLTFTTINGPDLLPPLVSNTAPASAATVSGSAVTLSANAWDNVSVANVQFEVDGVPVGSPLTVGPYEVIWDTTGTTDGAHTVSVVAEDPSGNYATSSETIVVYNHLIPWTNQTTGTSLSGLQWRPVAASADGSHLVAGAWGDNIYTSVNGGTTWMNRTSGTPLEGLWWQSIASSDDGSHLVAAENENGDLYTSTDGGASWINRTQGTSLTGTWWTAVISSSDGTHVAAITSGGDIFTSSNSGVTWVNRTKGTALSGLSWQSITSSASGADLVAVVGSGDIYASTDGGATWTNETTGTPLSGLNWTYVASSADGTYLVASDATDIFTSNDSGVTWTNRTMGTSLSGLGWQVAMSADGTHLVATGGSDIFTSTDGGASWTDQDAAAGPNFWSASIVLSSDGSTAVAVVMGGDIYTATVGTPSGPAPLNISFTNPSTGATVSGSSVSVSASTYGGSTVTGVQFQVDGVNLGSAITSDPYMTTWNSTSVADGSHTLTAIVTDSSGDHATSSVTVTVDNTPPDLASISATPGSPTTTITWTTNENATTRVVYGRTTSYGLASSTAGLVTAHSVTLTNLLQYTTFHYAVVSTDAQGNTATSSDHTFTTPAGAPDTPPQVSFSSPKNFSTISLSGTLTANATDTLAVASIQFAVDGTNIGTPITAEPYSFVWNSTGVAGGVHTLSAVAENTSGQYATSTITVMVNNAPVTWTAQTSAGSHGLGAIAASTDWKHVAAVGGGYLATSTDGGTTWTDSSFGGSYLASSADGTHLVATEGDGNVYVSADSGATWTPVFVAGGLTMLGTITSSADGQKIAVENSYHGYVYTSTDGGSTWTRQTGAYSSGWTGLASSADGSHLVAVNYGYIYTSTDSGATWTPQAAAGSRQWKVVASSADGTHLAAAVNNGDIYTSTDSGSTWTDQTFAGARAWSTLSSSADGSKLVAAVTNGDVYVSTDSGATWTDQGTAAGSRNWASVLMSSDGTKAAALDGSGYLYLANFNASAPTIVLTSPTNGDTVSGNVALAATTTDSTPVSSVWFEVDGVVVGAPATTSPFGITWDSTSVSTGSHTLVAVLEDALGNYATSSPITISVGSVTPITWGWTRQTASAFDNWRSITSSADGTKLAAIAYNGKLQTSPDGGATWITRTSAGTRAWKSITSSADGEDLAAVVEGGDIYTSTDGGVTWIDRNSAGQRGWSAITSSADGMKLAAAIGTGGYGYGYYAGDVYTSTDGGATWVDRSGSGSHNFYSITSSIDGMRLAAVDYNSGVFISTNGGATWSGPTNPASPSSAYWGYITSSADGMKLAVASLNGDIYTSVNGGSTWTNQVGAGAHEWQGITSSSDGSHLAATVYYPSANPHGGDIFTSIDGGSTWAEQAVGSSPWWWPIASSADGLHLFVGQDYGYIYTGMPTTMAPNIFPSSIIPALIPGLTSATINWTTNKLADSRVNYGTTTSYGASVSSSGFVGTHAIALSGLASGTTYHYQIQSTDQYGNATTSVDQIFSTVTPGADTTPPFVNLLSANGSRIFSSSYFMLAATSSDDTAVAQVQFKIDGMDIGAPLTKAPYSKIWHAMHISNGPHTLYAVAEDTSGNYATSTIGITVITAVWTKQVAAGQRWWNGITSSADGTHLAAIAGQLGAGMSNLYTSTDSGSTWTPQASAGVRAWNSVTSSSDGMRLAAIGINDTTAQTGDIYTSTDGGSTWQDQAGAGTYHWAHITSSADGMHLAAIQYASTTQSIFLGGSWVPYLPGDIYTSSDGGVTWIDRSGAGSRTWADVTYAADGVHLVAVAGANLGADTGETGDVYISADGGATWTDQTTAGARGWYTAAISADGSRLVAGVYGGDIYTSDDAGATWADRTLAGSAYWADVVSSADGNVIIAAPGGGTVVGGNIISSTDGGATWTDQTTGQPGGFNVDWLSAAVSTDGTHIAAAGFTMYEQPGYLYTDPLQESGTSTPLGISLIQPLNNAIVATTTTLVATTSGSLPVSYVQFMVDQTYIGSPVVSGDPYTLDWDSTTVVNGLHTLTAVAEDSGNEYATSSITVDVENSSSTPLHVSLIQPKQGAVVSATTTLVATTTDGVPVSYVQFMVGTTTIGSPVVSGNPYTISWDSTTVPNGVQTLLAVAKDSIGRYATSSITVDVENGSSTPLQVSLIQPVNGATVSGSSVSLVATTTDGVTVSYVQFQIDGVNAGAPVSSGNPYASTWDSTSVADGAHTIAAVATDVLSRHATSTISVTVSNGGGGGGGGGTTTPLTVALIAPPNGSTLSGSDITLVATTTDSVAVSYVQFQVDGVNTGSRVLGSTPFVSTWDSTSVANGAHTLTAVARDVSNNYATSTISVIVNNGASTTPSISVTESPAVVSQGAAPGAFGDTVNISWTAQNAPPGSAVALWLVQTDGTNKGLINSGLPASGSATWQVPGPHCDSHGLCIFGSGSSIYYTDLGSYKILAKLYTPSDAHIGGGLSYPFPTYVAQNVSNTFAIIAPPLTVSITQPTNHATVSGTSVGLAATVSDSVAVSYVQFMVDGTNIGAPQTTSYLTTWDSTIVPNGLHTLVAVAKDVSNNYATSSISVTVDNGGGHGTTTPLSVLLTNPADGSTISGTTTLTATTTDSVPVSSVQFQVDGTNVGAPVTSGHYAIPWDSTPVANGVHTLSAIAQDTEGNFATSSISVTVSNGGGHSLTISVTAPTDGTTIAGSAVDLLASVASTLSIVNVQFQVDGANVGAPATSGPYTTVWDSTSVADGSHTISAIAKDSGGYYATSTVAVTVNNSGGTPPSPPTPAPLTIALTDPVSGATVSGAHVTLGANVTDGVTVDQVQFLVDGTNVGAPVTSGPYTTAWDSTSVSDGSHTVQAVAKDSAGTYATSTESVIVHNSGSGSSTPLTVSFASPSDGATVSGSTLALTANVTDGIPVDSVQFQVDGTNFGAPVTTAYTTTWDTTSVTNGSHTLSAIAKDSGGNYATSTITVTVDNSASTTNLLTVAFVTPHDSATISGGSVPLSAVVSHTAAIDNVQFLIDDPEPVGVGEPATTTYDTMFDTTGIPNGVHELLVVAKDVLGNYATSTIFITIGNGGGSSGGGGGGGTSVSPFVVSMVHPTDGASVSGTVVLVGSASDDVTASITNLQFFVDGVSASPLLTSAPYTSSLDTTRLTNGTHRIAVVGRDSLGRNAIASVGVTVANDTVPHIPDTSSGSTTPLFTVAITDPIDNAILSGDSTPIAATTSDTVPVDYLEFYVDGLRVSAELTEDPYTTTLDTIQLTNGTHQLIVVGKDSLGRYAISAIPIDVENDSSTSFFVSLIDPSDGAVVASTTTLVAVTPDGVPVSFAQFQVDGIDVGSPITTPSPYAIDWDTTTTKNGLHTVSVVAEDLSGNEASSTITVDVENGSVMPFTIELTDPALGATVSGEAVPLSSTVYDTVPVDSVQYYVDGEAIGDPVADPYASTWDSTTVKNGTHIVSVVGTDENGVSATSTTQVRVKNATSTTPNAPNTGAGGETSENVLLLLLSLLSIVVGAGYLVYSPHAYSNTPQNNPKGRR